MKQEFIEIPEGNEKEIISEQLDNREMFVLSYLKGFNRKNMKEWSRKGIGIFEQSEMNE